MESSEASAYELSETERERVRKWAAKELERYGHSADEFDIEGYIDSGINPDENMKALGKEMRTQGLIGAKHQYASRNYVADQERKAQEAAEQAYFEEKKSTPYNPSHKQLPGAPKEFKGNIPHEKGEADVTELIEPEPAPSILGGVSAWISETKTKYIDEPASRKLKEREFKAEKSIEVRKERLEVGALEAKEKALAKREFEESPAGRILAGIKERHAKQGGYGYRATPPDVSPMTLALHGREEPMWLRESRKSETPGWMGGGTMGRAPAQRSMIMDVAMGRTSYGGYQGGYRQPRRKVITVNGRTYVVQSEPTREHAYAQGSSPAPSMLASAMFGSPASQQYAPRQRREPEHISPLAQAAMSGGSHETHSPLMQALFSGHGSSQPSPRKAERRSPLHAALEGSMFSHKPKKGGFKFF